MEIRLVCPRNGIVHPHRRLIDNDMRALCNADWAHKAGAAAHCTDCLFLRHTQFTRARNGVCELDLVHLVVAAQEGKDEGIVLRLIGDRLDRLFDGNL